MKKISEYVRHCNDLEKLEFNNFTIIPGTSNVMSSAPHSYKHRRNGKIKARDFGTLTIVKMLKVLTNAHIIYTNKSVNYDPNYDKNNPYQK